jgi:hypothetical protein
MHRRSVGQQGRPYRTRPRSRQRRKNARYKPKAKAGTVRRESERDIVARIAETTELGVAKVPHFGDARVARDGQGHG